MSVTEFLGTVAARWDPLREAAHRLGPAGLERKTSAGWSAKEMLAHVAFWEEAAIFVIEHMLRGKPEPSSWPFPSGYDPFAVAEDWPRDDVHNAREAAWARTQTGEAVIDRLDRAHAELLDLLRTVTEDELAASRYYDEIHEHFVEHLMELEPLLGSPAPGQG